jgi:tRNA dimethylallyltransferase
MSGPMTPPIGAIVGPTASGKSELALAVASRLPIEILVADSRQVYRGIDVGTAKPGPTERAAVPHHLLDLVEPDEAFTLADWLARARPLVDEVWARGRLPLLVGGTGLYVSALVDGYHLGARRPSPELRSALAAELEAEGLAPLADRLDALDPAAAARTDLRNPRRVLRALERAIGTGRATPAPAARPWAGPMALIGIARPRAVLDTRIRARAAWMFSNGLLDEVEALRERGIGPDLGPLTGHGYREALGVLTGELSVQEAVQRTALHTRQYAKRQLTWFRRDARIQWLAVGEGSAASVVDEAVERFRPLVAAA